MDQSTLTAVISPKSLWGTPKKFEFETQEAQDYVDTLEENLSHHAVLLKGILSKHSESFTSDSDTELRPPIAFEKLISDIQDLYSELKSTEAERKTFKSKSLINELFQHEHNEKSKEIIAEYEERINDLRFLIDRKDTIIYELQNIYSELEAEVPKQANENIIPVTLNSNILQVHSAIEMIRDHISNKGQDICMAYNFKEYLVDFYKKVWRKAQVAQALLRNPVNTKEGVGKSVKLNIQNEEPDLTLEFDDSGIEDTGHFRAYTIANQSFENPSHKRHTFSSGKELIVAVKSKLVSKIQRLEKRLNILTIDYQKNSEILFQMGKENFDLLQENSALASKLPKSSSPQ